MSAARSETCARGGKVRARALVVIVGALGAGCPPEPEVFASVNLTLREPLLDDDDARRALDTVLTIDFDGGADVRTVNFAPGVDIRTGDIRLGFAERTVEISLAIGELALGRADPFTLPAVGSPEAAEGVLVERGVLLAKPNVEETLDDDIPLARNGISVCNDDEGVAWEIGADNEGYTFDLDDLLADKTFALTIKDDDDVVAPVACDGDERGRIVVLVGFAPLAPDVPRAKLVVDAAGDATELAHDGPGTSPYVRYVGDGRVWAMSGQFVHVVALAESGSATESARLALQTSFGANVRYAQLSKDALYVEGDDDAAIVRFANGVLREVLDEPRGIGAADPNGFLLLEGDGDLVQPALNGDTLTLDVVRNIGPPITGVVRDMLVLRDGRVVVMNAEREVAVEGAPPITTEHERMALTVGGAILFFGRVDGHTVLVPP